MSLPTPSLDDRRFQDIVDEAKRRIPEYFTGWTDHNLSDPGIALLELFAWMTDLTLYRLNQVPDRLYVKFLDLLGLTLYPPAAATVDIVFWLSGPQTETVRIPSGTQVGTVRTEQDESVMFLTDETRSITAPVLTHCIAQSRQGPVDRLGELRTDGTFVECFSTVTPGDALYLGFEQTLGGTVIRLSISAPVHSAGVDPSRPPWVWEARVDQGWQTCRGLDDSTLALNRDGHLDLIVPRNHTSLRLGNNDAHWIRCRLLPPESGQQPLADSPKLNSLDVTARGGIARAHHGQPVSAEVLGRSDGTANQRFAVRRTPVLDPTPQETVVVVTDGELTPWVRVDSFIDTGPDDRHFTWDRVTGEVVFGPHFHAPDGTWRRVGAIPPVDAEIRTTGHRYGGGSIGNVGSGSISWLKSSLPFISRVENLDSATGGVDGETVDNAKLRGPLSLRTSDRAVTIADYERLTLEATPLVARTRCLGPDVDGQPIRVLIVPRLDIAPERVVLDDLTLSPDMIETVKQFLDERRLLTSAVRIAPPRYQGITVMAEVSAGRHANPEGLRDAVLTSLYRHINPLSGGPDGSGWPFSRTLTVGEVYALISEIDGVGGVESVTLQLRDLLTGERSDSEQRIRLPDDALFLSHQHQVRVL